MGGPACLQYVIRSPGVSYLPLQYSNDNMTWTRDFNDITTYGDVAIANKAYHVNGIKDVAFDTVDTITYNSTFSLASTAYNPATKLCSSVPCHLNQPIRNGANRIVSGTVGNAISAIV